MIPRASAIKVSDDLNKVLLYFWASLVENLTIKDVERLGGQLARPRLLNYITQSVILIHSTSAKCRFSGDPFRAHCMSVIRYALDYKGDYRLPDRLSLFLFFLVLPVPFARTQLAGRVISLFNVVSTVLASKFMTRRELDGLSGVAHHLGRN